jgi:dipeptidyl aminopeptidase/acylaminoacyl peptidase
VSDRRIGEDLDIWSMRPDADSEAGDFGPSWRPDGRKIAFMSDRVTADNPEGDFEIFVMNADGSGVLQLTVNTLDDELPSWSPDGRKLVFQRDFDPVVGEVDHDILTMQPDGTRQRNLTRPRASRISMRPGPRTAARSPSRPTATGTSRSTRWAPMGAGQGSGKVSLWAMRVV